LIDKILMAKFLEMFGDPATNPRGWEVRRLIKICNEIYHYLSFYGFKRLKKGIPVLKGEDIEDNKINPRRISIFIS